MAPMVEMPRREVPPPLELVKSRIEELLPPDALREIDAEAVTVIDTRPPEEFELGRIAGAVNVPAGENGVDSHSPDFARRVTEAAGGRPAVLYCNSGNRSARAADALTNEHGVEGSRSIIGGIKLWSDLGFPIEGSLPAPEEDDKEDGEG